MGKIHKHSQDGCGIYFSACSELQRSAHLHCAWRGLWTARLTPREMVRLSASSLRLPTGVVGGGECSRGGKIAYRRPNSFSTSTSSTSSSFNDCHTPHDDTGHRTRCGRAERYDASPGEAPRRRDQGKGRQGLREPGPGAPPRATATRQQAYAAVLLHDLPHLSLLHHERVRRKFDVCPARDETLLE